jgi:hypothetical protein
MFYRQKSRVVPFAVLYHHDAAAGIHVVFVSHRIQDGRRVSFPECTKWLSSEHDGLSFSASIRMSFQEQKSSRAQERRVSRSGLGFPDYTT